MATGPVVTSPRSFANVVAAPVGGNLPLNERSIDRPLTVVVRIPVPFRNRDYSESKAYRLITDAICSTVSDAHIKCIQPVNGVYRITFSNAATKNLFLARGLAVEGLTFPVQEADDKSTWVLIHRLPYEVPDVDLLMLLSQFGQVQQVKRVVDNHKHGWETGSRRVRMVVTRPIPRNLRLRGFACVAYYHRQPTSCSICGAINHVATVCPLRGKCRQCGEANHVQRDCPNGARGAQPSVPNTPASIDPQDSPLPSGSFRSMEELMAAMAPSLAPVPTPAGPGDDAGTHVPPAPVADPTTIFDLGLSIPSVDSQAFEAAPHPVGRAAAVGPSSSGLSDSCGRQKDPSKHPSPGGAKGGCGDGASAGSSVPTQSPVPDCPDGVAAGPPSQARGASRRRRTTRARKRTQPSDDIVKSPPAVRRKRNSPVGPAHDVSGSTVGSVQPLGVFEIPSVVANHLTSSGGPCIINAEARSQLPPSGSPTESGGSTPTGNFPPNSPAGSFVSAVDYTESMTDGELVGADMPSTPGGGEASFEPSGVPLFSPSDYSPGSPIPPGTPPRYSHDGCTAPAGSPTSAMH